MSLPDNNTVIITENVPVQYKTQIDEEINKLLEPEKNIQFIYGGTTTDTIQNRKEQHILENQPSGCDKEWNIKMISTHVVIHNDIDKELKDKIEKYIINSLQATFGDKYVSGGESEMATLNFLDKIAFYVFYKSDTTFIN